MLTLNFAREELNKYLKQITDKNNFEIEFFMLTKTTKTKFDDYYFIDINNGKGHIKAINERSILLGVYKFLESLGVVFYSPEKEYIPKKKLEECSFKYENLFKNKHRVVCLEGAVSLENILNMIDFIPKKQMNSYFIQFRKPYQFFDRWYGRVNHPYLRGVSISLEDVDFFVFQILKEIKKRSLIYHAVGHGWTTEVLGFSSLGWYQDDGNRNVNNEFIAEINGKREFYKNIPINTQLCYSNKKVQVLLVENVLEHLKNNPEIDVLHFWLADDFNNYCECEQCRKYLPSHFYIEILNLIDEMLTENKIDVKIMFLIYYELLWSTNTIKIKNEDRFILMYAPITRTYTKSMSIEGERPLPPFKVNKNLYSKDVNENLMFLKEWLKNFKGSAVLFDYHLMWDGFKELTHIGLSKTLYNDIMRLSELGLNGFISCQIQRIFFPTGILMEVLSKGLSGDKTTFEEILDNFFKKDKKLLNLLKKINSEILHKYMHQEIPMINKDVIKETKRILTVIENYDNDYVTYLKGWLKIISKKASGESQENLKIKTNEVIKELIYLEELYQGDFDGFYFAHILKEFVDKKW